MTNGKDALDSSLPLRIDRADYEDPVLLLGGDTWALSVLCSWRWIDSAGRLVSETTEHFQDELWELIGHQIIGVVWTDSPGFGSDPSFQLEDGGRIDLFSDASFDTWVLSLPAMTLVGPMTGRH